MNLLVTGCAGFIGSHFTDLALTNPQFTSVVGLDCLSYASHIDNLSNALYNPKFSLIVGDIRDKDLVRSIFKRHNISHVAHLAAESHVDRSITSPDAFISTNIAGTFNLLEAARMCWDPPHNQRFLHVSTDEVFGSIPNGSFTEDSPYAPNSPYASSKAASDMLVRAYRHTFNLPAIITHCSNNYGPRQYPEKLIPKAITCLINKSNIPLHGDGSNVRDWIHVSDHASALLTILLHSPQNETFLIGAQNELSNLHILKTICTAFDRITKSQNSASLISHVQDRPGNDLRYSVNPHKLSSQLNWKPSRPFLPYLHHTIRWYLNEHKTS
jgi:dTDP-glucose 4,6-dehydratase